MLLSATKLPGCYTEGVVLAKRVEALFRVVPPSLYLALGMTEKEEKAERRQLMNQHHCSELEAAFRMARKLDEGRGIMTPKGASKTGDSALVSSKGASRTPIHGKCFLQIMPGEKR